jgi:hypothetical protein
VELFKEEEEASIGSEKLVVRSLADEVEVEAEGL